MKRALALILGLQLCAWTACEPVKPPAHPSLRMAQRNGPIAIYEALEKLIADGRDKEVDREQAYELVKEFEDDGTARYAFARAAIVGRVAEEKGLTAIWLVKEAEAWARKSVKRDPNYRDGAGRRMLGTLYVLAGDRLENGDSETGLEILEGLVEERPNDPVNRLRLSEGYVALGDHESAFEHLCITAAARESLQRWELELLDGLILEVGGMEVLGCSSAGGGAG